MPHQCLKCGKVFPSGSMEIFKGCSNCSGKRFFYTENPISEDERQVLTERANKDIKELVRDLLTQQGQDSTLGKDEIDSKSGWVKVDKDMNVEAVSEPSFTGPGEAKSKLQKLLDEETEAKAPPKKTKVETVSKDIGSEVDETPVKSIKKPVRGVRHKVLDKEEISERPEVITIVEPGVYEIDLENLMDRSPIIIYKDGTYLLHLPSLFNKPIRK